MRFDIEFDESLRRFVGYIKTISPIAFLHLIFPPLSNFGLFPELDPPPPDVAFFINVIRRLAPAICSNEDFILSLLFQKKNNEYFDDPNTFLKYQVVTHMFIHKDYNHLLNNLFSMILVGQPVHAEFNSSLFYYLVFLGGGVSASLPIYKTLSLTAKSFNLGTFIGQGGSGDRNNSTNHPNTGNPIIDFFQPKLKELTKKVTSLLNVDLITVSCGSSGGVTALLGSSFIITLKDTIQTVYKLSYSLPNNNKTNNTQELKAVLLRDIGKCAYNAYFLSQTMNFLYLEYLGITQQRDQMAKNSSMNPFTWFFKGTSVIVDHEAHLQGFLFGAAITLARYYCLKRSSESGNSNGGGRRLGGSTTTPPTVRFV
jgi:membrane associated rhomboid family serine protease